MKEAPVKVVLARTTPPEMLMAPVYPPAVNVSVPPPVLLRAPLPFKPPAWVKVCPSLTLMPPPLELTVIPAFELPVKPAVTSRVPPFKVNQSVVLPVGVAPSPLAAATEIVPALMVVLPVKVLTPLRVSFPAPLLVSPPEVVAMALLIVVSPAPPTVRPNVAPVIPPLNVSVPPSELI